MTSGLRWPWCGILTRHGSRVRMTCKSSFVSSWGYYTNVPTTHILLWSSSEQTNHTHTHTNSDTQLCTCRDAEAQTRGKWKFHMCISHMTALWIIELSWSSWSTLWCAHRESLTCQTLHYTHIHVDKLSFFFFRMFLQLQQMWLFLVCLSSFLVVSNGEAITDLSPSQIRHSISQARSHYWNA